MSTLTKGQVVQKYKTAEKAASAALASAKDLNFDVGPSKKPTSSQVTQMTSLLTKAWTQGHEYVHVTTNSGDS